MGKRFFISGNKAAFSGKDRSPDTDKVFWKILGCPGYHNGFLAFDACGKAQRFFWRIVERAAIFAHLLRPTLVVSGKSGGN